MTKTTQTTITTIMNILILIGIMISIPSVNDTMYPILVGLLTVLGVTIISGIVVLYTKFMLSTYIYIRTVVTTVESCIYLLLATQVNWIFSIVWGVFFVIALVLLITHVIFLLSRNEHNLRKYNTSVTEASNATHDTIHRWKRWINDRFK